MSARIAVDPLDGSDEVEIIFTRTKLDELIQPILGRCIEIVKLAVEDANLDPAESIQEVVLVGGSTRIRKLQ